MCVNHSPAGSLRQENGCLSFCDSCEENEETYTLKTRIIVGLSLRQGVCDGRTVGYGYAIHY